jgi:Flp pilus assembly protein TadD
MRLPPDVQGYWNELGRGFAARARYEEALACYDHALAIRGDIPQILTNRGRALRNLDRLDEAETSLREAVRVKPDFANAHNELATVLDYLGRFEEAEASVRTALRFQPQDALAHYNLGKILYHLRRASEAQASYRTALSLQPEVPEWRVALGQALLLTGQFAEGWNEFEWRWQTERMRRLGPLFPVPAWNGEAIEDRVILLLADQGHGDTLQFCRYVPQIAAGARGTVLAVQPSLVRLVSRLAGVSEIITQDGQPSSFDLWCALMSLPHAIGTTLETIPATTPYLTADPADVAYWRERLAGLAGLRVGLCWAGGRSADLNKIAADRRRSITLDTLALLGEISGVQFISLQKGPPAAEAARPPRGMQLHDFTEDLHDFADTAALIEGLDLVISVDTAVAHLAGALGKPVWLLTCFDACFRWLQNRDDSPWYPSLRHFRQPTPGDWHSVISRARDALQRLAAGDHSQLRRPTLTS